VFINKILQSFLSLLYKTRQDGQDGDDLMHQKKRKKRKRPRLPSSEKKQEEGHPPTILSPFLA
jgi:hypothetical protein